MENVKVERNMVIDAMVKGNGEIAILRDINTNEVEVVNYETGWLESYAEQNRKEVVFSFDSTPSDRGYHFEGEEPNEDKEFDEEEWENHLYTDADADVELDSIDFPEKIELI